MIGQKIFYFRKSKGLTQEQLAQGICSVPHLSKIENGHETPSTDILEHLCSRLGIPIGELHSTEDTQAMVVELDQWYELIVNRESEQAKIKMEQIEEMIKAYQDPLILLRYELFTIRYHLALQQFSTVKKLFVAVDKFKKTMDEELRYYYHLFYGIFCYLTEEYVESLQSFKEAERLTKNLRVAVAELYYQLALTHSQLHHITFSNYYANEALQKFNHDCNYIRSIECQILLGINGRRMGNYMVAKKHYENALQISKRLNHSNLIGTTYHNLGLLHEKDNPKIAIENYMKSLEYRQEKDIEKKVRTYYCLAKLGYYIKDNDAAKKWIKKGIDLVNKHSMIEFQHHFNVLEFKSQNEFSSDFENLLKQKVIPYFQQKEKWYYVAEYAELLANYYSAQYKYKDANHYLRVVNESIIKLYPYH